MLCWTQTVATSQCNFTMVLSYQGINVSFGGWSLRTDRTATDVVEQSLKSPIEKARVRWREKKTHKPLRYFTY